MSARTDSTATPGIVAFAPGGIGNIGPGLDVLGCALAGAGDEVHAWWTDEPGVRIVDAGHPELPLDPARNSCGIAAVAVLARAREQLGMHRERGLALRVHKGLPLCAGQGGSSASAVAAAVAVDRLVITSGGDALDRASLLEAALQAEAHVSGRHMDNLAASLLGGIVCVRSIDPVDVTNVPVNFPLCFALAHPAIRVRTADARAVLPSSVSRDVMVAQLASVASMVTALATGNPALFGRALVDHVAEPARVSLVPGFAEAKRAALETGALGVSLSGSGPTTFAACSDEPTAHAAAEAMRWAFEAAGHSCTTRVCAIDLQGARWRHASAPDAWHQLT